MFDSRQGKDIFLYSAVRMAQGATTEKARNKERE
jgi:hypothetical protein